MALTKAGEQLIPYVDEVLTSVSRLRNFEDGLAMPRGSAYRLCGIAVMLSSSGRFEGVPQTRSQGQTVFAVHELL